MARDEQLKIRWEALNKKLSEQFADGDTLDLDGIIYLIGLQELGKFNKKFNPKRNAIFMPILCITLYRSFL